MIRIATTENPQRLHHYQDVVTDPGFEFVGNLSPPFDETKLKGIDAFIVSCEHYQPSRLAIAACKRFSIPSFHVIDGIVEWRNLFDNPRTSIPENGAPLFQPLLSDVTFALGPIQKQVLNWLGNSSVHDTGLPRLDLLQSKPCRHGAPSNAQSLVVATANTPWFTPEQQAVLVSEFKTLANLLAGESDFDISFRVSAGLERELGVNSELENSAIEMLSSIDALITTPSSLAIEAIIMGVPTMIFDPYGCPVLTPAAWYSSSATGVIRALPSLMTPPQSLASLQDTLRRQVVRYDGNSAERIREIIVAVVAGEDQTEPRDCKVSGERISVPGSGPLPYSESDVQALLASLPSFDATMARQAERIYELESRLARPTFRNLLGTLYRFVKKFFSQETDSS